MKHPIILLAAVFFPAAGFSQTSGGLQSSNILNPNISLIGWFQGETGNKQLSPGAETAPSPAMRESELAFQSVVDPYARADFFISLDGEGNTSLEEGYIDWFSLPGGLAFKTGKFRNNFGKFNRVHLPETSFADRPAAHEEFLGRDGLAGTGGSLSWQVPNPWIFVEFNGEAVTMPKARDVPVFDTARRADLLYVGRLNTYADITESSNFTFGASLAEGAAGMSYDATELSSHTLKSRLYGLDATFRWKNPRRAIYRSLLWQTELLWSDREYSAGSVRKSWGMFTHLEYQFARRWRAGARYDFAQSVQDNSRHDEGQLAYLTFYPSEFSLISLQGKHSKKPDSFDEYTGILKITFNIGPHGTHPF